MNLSANSLYSNSLASLDGIIASSPIYKSAQVKKHNHYQTYNHSVSQSLSITHYSSGKIDGMSTAAGFVI